MLEHPSLFTLIEEICAVLRDVFRQWLPETIHYFLVFQSKHHLRVLLNTVVEDMIVPYFVQVKSLKELQECIYEMYAPKKFNPHGKDPLLYFQVLLLTLQFERVWKWVFFFCFFGFF
jgi:hypothetical protein